MSNKIDFAIIAAGEGSRLAQSGYPYPKPLARLHGETLVDRLMAIFSTYGANSINLIINEESTVLEEYLQKLSLDVPFRLIKQTTESSLHSLDVLLKGIPEVSELCLTTVDTIFRAETFESYLDYFQEHPELDALMAVTPFVDDESPLFVDADEKGRIKAFTDVQTPGREVLVSGGIYALRKAALSIVDLAVRQDIQRMRNYQRLLLQQQLKVEAFVFDKIIDIDHLSDLRTAEEWLSEVIYPNK